MTRLVRGLVALSILCGALVSSSPATAQTIPIDQAAEAIAKSLDYAGQRGLTYREQGELRQRSAAGDVAVRIESRKVTSMVLREGNSAVLLAPAGPTSNDRRISDAVRKGFGIGKNAFAVMPIDDDGDTTNSDYFLSWFDPFSAYAEVPTLTVELDSVGRIAAIRDGRQALVQVVAWEAPLAVKPPASRIMDTNTWWTTTYAEASAEFLLTYLDGIGQIAQAYPGFSSAPIPTLRKAARDTGWQAKDSNGGITITLTDGVGLTWRAVFVASSSSVRITKFTLVSRPQAMPQEEVYAKMLMGLFAISQLTAVTCPLKCLLEGGPTPLTAANAEKVLLKQLKDFGVSQQTPGPDYPELDDGMLGSFGVTVTGSKFTGGLSFSLNGFCLAVPFKGPGVLQLPSSYASKPGQVGPLGTCRA